MLSWELFILVSSYILLCRDCRPTSVCWCPSTRSMPSLSTTLRYGFTQTDTQTDTHTCTYTHNNRSLITLLTFVGLCFTMRSQSPHRPTHTDTQTHPHRLRHTHPSTHTNTHTRLTDGHPSTCADTHRHIDVHMRRQTHTCTYTHTNRSSITLLTFVGLCFTMRSQSTLRQTHTQTDSQSQTPIRMRRRAHTHTH